MRKEKPISPEYLFWRKRVEGQIRHTMHEHPEFFTKAAYEDNMVGRMAKRIIGEIVAGIITGNHPGGGARVSASASEHDVVELRRAASGMVGGSTTADHLQHPSREPGV